MDSPAADLVVVHLALAMVGHSAMADRSVAAATSAGEVLEAATWAEWVVDLELMEAEATEVAVTVNGE